MLAEVKFEGVHKIFGTETAVEDLNLSVQAGEFMVLVGPSGCGKTTTLRMLAGLERPSYGRILIGDKLVNNVPPRFRDVAMVFQSYALYPHMNVYDNLAFGMRAHGAASSLVEQRVKETAEVLGLGNLLKRRPSELSGGQRQRVALGRALIRQPQVFLMDEPLSNLDAGLRVQMRAELSRLHERFRVTALYVTHDHVEAMTIGDRIAVMDLGRRQRVDAPLSGARTRERVELALNPARLHLFDARSGRTILQRPVAGGADVRRTVREARKEEPAEGRSDLQRQTGARGAPSRAEEIS